MKIKLYQDFKRGIVYFRWEKIEIAVTEDELWDACMNCLKQNKKLVTMTDRHTYKINGQHYTHLMCQECGYIN